MQLLNQTFDIQVTSQSRPSLQIADRLLELTGGSGFVEIGQVMHADGRLDQTLVTDLQRRRGQPPQVFPNLVGFIVFATVKEENSFVEQVCHEHKSN